MDHPKARSTFYIWNKIMNHCNLLSDNDERRGPIERERYYYLTRHGFLLDLIRLIENLTALLETLACKYWSGV